jgi:two-component system, OmpR family, sensor histidine kinase VicK
MFESVLLVPLHFTVEFVGLLVTVGGAILVATRPGLIPGAAPNRSAASLGFAALAAAQVLHGGAFLQADGDDLLVGLRAFGLALILVGVVGGFRVEAGAFAAVTDRPFLMAPAVAGILLALMASLGARRAGPRSLNRLALAALMLGIASAFVAAVPEAHVDVGRPEPLLLAAHGIELVGYLVIASWLWTGVRSSISTRFVASFTALLVVVILTLSTALTAVISRNVEDEELRRIGIQLANAVRGIEQDDTQELLRDVRRLAGSDPIRRDIALGADLSRLSRSLIESELFAMQFIVFDTRDGVGFYGSGPARFRRGEIVEPRLRRRQVLRVIGSPIVEAVAGRGFPDVAASLDKLGNSVAILAAAELPHPDQPRRVLGTVVIGTWVDARALDRISASVGTAQSSLVVDGAVALTELPQRSAVRRDLLPPDVQESLRAGDDAAHRGNIADAAYLHVLAPLTDAPAALALSSPAELVVRTREDITRTLFLVALGAAVVVLLLAWASGRRITRPIKTLTTTARAVREGDLSAHAEVGGEDEVGQLGETFNDMTAALFRMTNDLRQAAREEEALRARIETIIQSMADGLVAVDARKRVLAFNLEARSLTGIEPTKAIGEDIESVVDARDLQGEKLSLPIFDLREGSVGGVLLQHRDGRQIAVDVTCAVLHDDEDQVAGGVAVFRDMTREREIERMKTEFLSNISHELRTPLTPIKGYAQILGRKGTTAGQAKRFVEGILESTSRLERIVGLLLDFSAMEAGRLAPRTVPVDIGHLVARLSDEWQTRAPNHEVVAEVRARLPKVLGDERLLRRSLEEVLDNAVKFSPEGGTILLQARGTRAGDGRVGGRAVEIVISDEGIGITPEELPNIFSDFHQLDASETRPYGGLGLGLAFVRRIVDAHEGRVEVESEPERGTRLRITIPAAKRSRA